jgi:hypothetical protein
VFPEDAEKALKEGPVKLSHLFTNNPYLAYHESKEDRLGNVGMKENTRKKNFQPVKYGAALILN